MKAKTVFVCCECGYESAKWYGKCPGCENWNTMLEQIAERPARGTTKGSVAGMVTPVSLDGVDISSDTRIKTGLKELDAVLGGGLVRGSSVLVGGEPGIGKSTLLLQICREIAQNNPVIYISGEESLGQIKQRAQRLCIDSCNIMLATCTNVEEIITIAREKNPQVLIIDSIQTMYCDELTSATGSVSQVRQGAMLLSRFAKDFGVTVIMVGHVTKDGAIAGPKILEHMVDCVLYFEGERHLAYRIIRCAKNRYGSTNEIGVFDMTANGLEEIGNPSAKLLEGRPQGVSGICVTCVIEGARPILAEVQALVTPSFFGNPRRMATGVDYNRLSMIIAVLEKRCGLNLSNKDIFVNIVGGIKVNDPSSDLAITLAITSSYKDIPLEDSLIATGEIGLGGEVRAISGVDKRINEGIKMGFQKIIVPHCDSKNNNIDIIKCKNIMQTVKLVF